MTDHQPSPAVCTDAQLDELEGHAKWRLATHAADTVPYCVCYLCVVARSTLMALDELRALRREPAPASGDAPAASAVARTGDTNWAPYRFNAERAIAKCDVCKDVTDDGPGYCGKCGWARALLQAINEIAAIRAGVTLNDAYQRAEGVFERWRVTVKNAPGGFTHYDGIRFLRMLQEAFTAAEPLAEPPVTAAPPDADEDDLGACEGCEYQFRQDDFRGITADDVYLCRECYYAVPVTPPKAEPVTAAPPAPLLFCHDVHDGAMCMRQRGHDGMHETPGGRCWPDPSPCSVCGHPSHVGRVCPYEVALMEQGPIRCGCLDTPLLGAEPVKAAETPTLKPQVLAGFSGLRQPAPLTPARSEEPPPTSEEPTSCADALLRLAAWIRQPGNINPDDARDECARLLQNNVLAFRAIEREAVRLWLDARIAQLEAELAASAFEPSHERFIRLSVLKAERASGLAQRAEGQ